MEPEDFMLNEINQPQKNKYCILFTHMWTVEKKSYMIEDKSEMVIARR